MPPKQPIFLQEQGILINLWLAQDMAHARASSCTFFKQAPKTAELRLIPLQA
jgi:hypothetical protein